jgi:hypothetical protein
MPKKRLPNELVDQLINEYNIKDTDDIKNNFYPPKAFRCIKIGESEDSPIHRICRSKRWSAPHISAPSTAPR